MPVVRTFCKDGLKDLLLQLRLLLGRQALCGVQEALRSQESLNLHCSRHIICLNRAVQCAAAAITDCASTGPEHLVCQCELEVLLSSLIARHVCIAHTNAWRPAPSACFVSANTTLPSSQPNDRLSDLQGVNTPRDVWAVCTSVCAHAQLGLLILKRNTGDRSSTAGQLSTVLVLR